MEPKIQLTLNLELIYRSQIEMQMFLSRMNLHSKAKNSCHIKIQKHLSTNKDFLHSFMNQTQIPS